MFPLREKHLPVKIIIEVQGGIVQAVYCNLKKVKVEINDYDDKDMELNPMEQGTMERIEKEALRLYQVY